MAYDAGGTYSLPSPQAFPVAAAVISSADYKAVLADIAGALNLALPRNGSASLTGNLNLGGRDLTNGYFKGLGITLASGVIRAGAGTTALPGFAFTADAAAGFSYATNQVYASVSGAASASFNPTNATAAAGVNWGLVTYTRPGVTAYHATNAEIKTNVNSSDAIGLYATSSVAELRSALTKITFSAGNGSGYSASMVLERYKAYFGTGGVNDWAGLATIVASPDGTVARHAYSAELASSPAGSTGYLSRIVATTQSFAAFFYGSGGSPTQVGGITTNGTTTTYNTTSDERMKEAIVELPKAWNTIRKLQPRQFRWKTSHEEDVGFIAQELKTVFPNAVHTPQDPDAMMGVDASKLMPFVIAALQDIDRRLTLRSI